MPKIQPFLWFDTQAEEAANFYVSIFGDAKILQITRYGESPPNSAKPGSAMTVSFELCGLQFLALNGGPHFKFTEATSFLITPETQEEIDDLWEKLCGGGGEAGQCGWLKDKYGLSWQVAPSILGTLLSDSDPVKSNRVMQSMLGMTKIIIADLQSAYDSSK
jgi:predicted 3-demethylubiquinone-9 3-methyltransferase (glyoxalase superfamily)